MKPHDWLLVAAIVFCTAGILLITQPSTKDYEMATVDYRIVNLNIKEPQIEEIVRDINGEVVARKLLSQKEAAYRLGQITSAYHMVYEDSEIKALCTE